ncbi:hypothetical protein ACOSP7_010518 [Xanthoceras sorbifolium]|uniref:ZCF37 n=1 Tax=Xanthoceras sorbifolium TaxID=99658 RepID=A0ABQ8HT88_9ROSI|nr:hypothetical protein JRO89_XS07G0087500 [Xanthoceras sorbifolium]
MMESPTTPGKLRRNSFCSRSFNKKDSKNPYSNRGLDKFSALVAELEEKRQKILSQKGSEEISLVRFVYKDTHDCVPIVVKVKKDNKEGKTKRDDHHIKQKTIKDDNSEIMDKFPIDCCCSESDQKEDRLRRPESDKKIAKKMKFSWNIWRQPSYYLPVVVVLILLLLAFFGRSFVIICTSVGWYIIPTIKGSGSSNVIRSVKKKEYVKKLSDKKMVSDGLSSPKTTRSLNNSGNLKDQSPRKHSHRKSW